MNFGETVDESIRLMREAAKTVLEQRAEIERLKAENARLTAGQIFEPTISAWERVRRKAILMNNVGDWAWLSELADKELERLHARVDKPS